MALVKLDWQYVEFLARNVDYWKDLKRYARDDRTIDMLRSKRSVYVIRVCRPFAFQYKTGRSPVAYIGKGDAPARLRSHLGGWVGDLKDKFPDLKMRIYVCEPKIRKSDRICEQVEADLINEFFEELGESPLRNRQRPRSKDAHVYNKDELKILYLGKGFGYYWAIRPMRSNLLHKD